MCSFPFRYGPTTRQECIYENLLGQKQEIARQEVRLATVEREEAEERERSRQEARSRVLAEFERSQVGLGGSVRGEDGRDQRAQGGKERQSQVTANQASEGKSHTFFVSHLADSINVWPSLLRGSLFLAFLPQHAARSASTPSLPYLHAQRK